MTAADVVVSRAGAIALTEIMACGKPAIFVPSPNVTNNHQYHNAMAVAEKGAAVLVEEKDLVPGNGILASEIFKLVENKDKLVEMGAKAKALATIDAADIIYDNLIFNK